MVILGSSVGLRVSGCDSIGSIVLSVNFGDIFWKRCNDVFHILSMEAKSKPVIVFEGLEGWERYEPVEKQLVVSQQASEAILKFSEYYWCY